MFLEPDRKIANNNNNNNDSDLNEQNKVSKCKKSKGRTKAKIEQKRIWKCRILAYKSRGMRNPAALLVLTKKKQTFVVIKTENVNSC